VRNLTVVAQAHNVTIWLRLGIPPSTKDAPGSVYCAVFPANSPPPASADLVVSNGVMVTYKSALSRAGVYVTVPGLISLASYQSYCYVEAQGGIGMSNAAVLKTAATFDTACCKAIAFGNAPTYVFGDVTKYPAGTASSKYVFTYSVEAYPRYDPYVAVTPRFYFLNGSRVNGGISAVPRSVTFTPGMAATQLTSAGQFYIVASPLVSGTIVVRLGVSGSTEYGSDSTAVQILSVNAALPAPQLVSAAFGSNGATFSVNFDQDTDQAGISAGTWPCVRLFNFTGSILLAGGAGGHSPDKLYAIHPWRPTDSPTRVLLSPVVISFPAP
jgi:hypothetical protein